MAGQFQRKSAPKGKQRSTREKAPQTQPVSFEHEQIAKWFQTVKFRKAAFGGVDESDLWKKLNELNTLYDQALLAERARYDALLQAQSQQNKPSSHEDEWEGTW